MNSFRMEASVRVTAEHHTAQVSCRRQQQQQQQQQQPVQEEHVITGH